MICGVKVMIAKAGISDKQAYINEVFDSLKDIFVDSDYSIRINLTDGNGSKLIDIFRNGENRRCMFMAPRIRSRDITLCLRRDLWDTVSSNFSLPQPTEIKKGRNLNWHGYEGLSLDTVCSILSYIADR